MGIKGPSSPSRGVVVAWSVFTVECRSQAAEEEGRTWEGAPRLSAAAATVATGCREIFHRIFFEVTIFVLGGEDVVR